MAWQLSGGSRLRNRMPARGLAHAVVLSLMCRTSSREVVALSVLGDAAPDSRQATGVQDRLCLLQTATAHLRSAAGGTAAGPEDAAFFGAFSESTEKVGVDQGLARAISRHGVSEAAVQQGSFPLGRAGQFAGTNSSWSQRSINTTITCQHSGCSATASLQAYNPAVERARNCHLSVFFHPTDFDDQYSGERVLYVKANGVVLQSDCFPMLSGCNATNTMFACAKDVPVDSIISAAGVLEVSTAISDEVDECPYFGNLLSAVPMVSCLIAPLGVGAENATESLESEESENATEGGNGSTTTATAPSIDDDGTVEAEDEEPPVPLPSTPPPPPAFPVVPEPLAMPTFLELAASFRCPSRGCSTAAEFQLNQTAVPFKQCLLTVQVYQTDFDDGDTEKIEYIEVNDVVVAKDVTPGGNPCQAVYLGKALDSQKLSFVALRHEDVTRQVENSKGHLYVKVKISDHVDECAHEGYLLSGLAQLQCTFGAPGGQPQARQQELAAASEDPASAEELALAYEARSEDA